MRKGYNSRISHGPPRDRLHNRISNGCVLTPLQSRPRDASPSYCELYDRARSMERIKREHEPSASDHISDIITYTPEVQNCLSYNSESSLLSCIDEESSEVISDDESSWSSSSLRNSVSDFLDNSDSSHPLPPAEYVIPTRDVIRLRELLGKIERNWEIKACTENEDDQRLEQIDIKEVAQVLRFPVILELVRQRKEAIKYLP